MKVDLKFADISRKLRSIEFPKVDYVIGIGTGGVVPASMVAHQLGCDLKIIQINYRDPDNQPRYDQPKVLQHLDLDIPAKAKILLVDDVSVSGKTLSKAKEQLKALDVTTFTLKGQADIVLFPDVKSCVNWPWKESEN